jgi:hypothetical protein
MVREELRLLAASIMVIEITSILATSLRQRTGRALSRQAVEQDAE